MAKRDSSITHSPATSEDEKDRLSGLRLFWLRRVYCCPLGVTGTSAGSRSQLTGPWVELSSTDAQTQCSGYFFILITVSGIPLFKQPIYFFFFHLSFMDICYTSTVTPRLVQDLLSEKKAISFDDCIMHLFDMHFFGSIEVFILEGMAYDHYVVISKPLSYMIIMNQQRWNTMVAICWGAGFLHSMIQLLLAISLPFCGPNKIDRYFFDVYPLLDLACTDTDLIGFLILPNSGIVVLTFIVLVFSDITILVSLRTRSSEGQCKALSSCASYITVVALFCFVFFALHLNLPPANPDLPRG
ncbi:olfactory receptor 4P4-like [Tachyglossus aculeatus]|uniref:olfactory receptor 4P4-like n=1 Tax=Tachyglossus aculeatus TaxID=9261 RepID=UPI0018F69D85|nr:olfactory receptor 4P4-like [Tachyglossus aculeatus]